MGTNSSPNDSAGGVAGVIVKITLLAPLAYENLGVDENSLTQEYRVSYCAEKRSLYLLTAIQGHLEQQSHACLRDILPEV